MALSINNALSWIDARDVYVNDAGTWRRIREIYVNDAGTWRRVHYSGLVEATLTAGQLTSNVGYMQSNFGSMSQTTLSDGKVITALYHHSTIFTEDPFVELTITGFSSDPGANYLSLLTIAGWGDLPGGALYYLGFGSSTIRYRWDNVGQPFTNLGVYSISVVLS